jgi:hypothetical protein
VLLSIIPSLRPDRQAYKAENMTWLERNQAFGGLWAKKFSFLEFLRKNTCIIQNIDLQ